MIHKNKIVIEIQYLPTIAFFSYWINSEELFLEKHENYSKGSYRNRCKILSSQGPLSLSIPLIKGKNNQLNISKVKIDHKDQWQKRHLRGIMACYGKAPFFEYYFDDIKRLINRRTDYLFELNINIIEGLGLMIGIDKGLKMTKTFESKLTDKVDKRNFISPKSANESTIFKDFEFFPYEQVFKKDNIFYDNLSILDLLFCKGPESVLYLRKIYKAKES